MGIPLAFLREWRIIIPKEKGGKWRGSIAIEYK